MKPFVFFLICVLASSSNFAAYAASQKTVSKWTYSLLQDIDKLSEKSSYKEAENLANSTLEKVSNPYEKAIILLSLAGLYSMQEKYEQATKSLANALALNELEDEQQLMGWLQLGQLYASTENWKKATETLEKWISLGGKPSSENLILLANCYVQLQQFKNALPHVLTAVKQAKKPQESWYRLLLAIRYELKQYSEAVSVLKVLIKLDPENETYWDQLAGIHQQLDQYEEAATVTELAYYKGVVTDSRKIMSLIQLLQYIKAPQRAAVILGKELDAERIEKNADNFESLSNAWLQAREYGKAADALKQAAALKKDGSLYYRLAQIQLADESWQEAAASLAAAIDKGGVKSEGEALVLLGIANYEAGDFEASRKAFLDASGFPEVKEQAQQWLVYVEESLES